MKWKNKLSLLLVVIMLASLAFVGCSSPGSPTTAASTTAAPTTTAMKETTKATTVAENVYPIKTSEKLTLYTFYNRGAKTHQNYADTPFAKYLAEKTGVKVEYTYGTAEQFNISFASGVSYDIIEYPFATGYPGGPAKAIKDGVIIKLNDLMKLTPNLNMLLKKNPSWDKLVKTDDGTYFTFPFLRGDDRLKTYQGPIIRQDWLDELGLKKPETVDELEAILIAFKDKKGATAPLSVLNPTSTFFITLIGSAYNLAPNVYVDNGKIAFSAYQNSYKDFLAKLNDWYKKGLIDPAIGAVDQKILDANVLNGITGVTVHNTGGGIGRWMDSKKDDPKYNLAGFKNLVMKKGETPFFGQVESAFPGATSISISKFCKNPELAAKYLDYGYSEEGYMVYNFGKEGEAYTMVNGYPTFTDLIMKNPNLGVADSLAIYSQSNGGGPFVQDVRYLDQYTARQSQKDAVVLWSATNGKDHILPSLYFTEDEAKQIGKLSADITTFVNEKSIKFIVGAESLGTYDSYITMLEKLGVKEFIAIYEAAYARFLKR